MTVGEKLQVMRAEAGLTQIALAKRCGVPSNIISLIENGVTKRPRVTTLHKIANTLGRSVTELMPERPKE